MEKIKGNLKGGCLWELYVTINKGAGNLITRVVTKWAKIALMKVVFGSF